MRCNRLAAMLLPAMVLTTMSLPTMGLLTTATSWGQVSVREADLRVEVRPQHVAGRMADDLSAAAAAYQRHEYTLQPDGNLLGKVQTIDDAGSSIPARVRLYFLRRGAVVTHSLPDEQGSFQASGLTPGYYSVVAAGQGGFSAVAVRILPPPERPEPPKANTIGQSKTVSLQNVVSIPLNVSTIQPIDVRPAFYLAQRYVPGMSNVPTPYSEASRNRSLPVGGDRTAAQARGTNVQNASADSSELTALSEASLEAYEKAQYPLNADGSLSGQLRMVDETGAPLPANVRLFFLRAGRVVTQTAVDASGRFVTQQLEPGYYSVVAAGPSGFAASGVRVVAHVQRLPVPKTNTISNTRTISMSQTEGVPLNMAPIPVQDVSQTQQIAQQENPGGVGDAPPPPPTDTAGGMAAGGGGSGGGGGGGLGGAVAGALLAGGIAGGIGAASGDGDGTTVTTTTSNSPTMP
jgi:hypothetical protein